MARTIFHIDLDAFFISVEQVLNPELRGRPAAVGGQPEGRGVVACASYEARQYGLHAGMPVASALRLCPRLVLLPGSFAIYRDYSAGFMDILADFSPDLQPGGLDEAWLDLTGFDPIYGPPREAGLRIKGRVKGDLGLTASIGIAPSRIVAKVASDFSKPDGLVEVLPGQEKEFLSPLPVRDLPGVGPKMQGELKCLGVTSIGQLADMPVSLLKSKFGVSGEAFHRHANGIDDSPVEPGGPVKSISRENTLARDTTSPDYLRSRLRHLVERVGNDLRGQGKQARTVSLKVRYAGFDTCTRSRTLKVPTDADDMIFKAGAELMEGLLAKNRQAVRLIGIRVSGLLPAATQLSLLDRSTERRTYLDRAIDEIRLKYGFDIIETGRTLPLRNGLPAKGLSAGEPGNDQTGQ